MLDLKVQTFLTVCKQKNFTRAAEKLHITQPAVSVHIKGLEEYYGVPLFQFQGKRFELTSYGELIYQSLLSLQNNDRFLKETLSAMKEHTSLINMGATITLAEFMISDSITNYIKKNPNAKISAIMGNTKALLAMLDSGTIDFALLEGDFSKITYAYQKLYDAEFTAVCAYDYPIKDRFYTLPELLSERLLVREAGSGTRSIFTQILENEGYSINDFAHVTTIGCMNAIIDLAKNGCGITFLYKKSVQPLLDQNILKEISLSNFPIQHEISAVWRKDTLEDENVRTFIRDLFS